MKKLISLLYALIIASAITTFVGLGSYAFYPGPQHDQTCYELNRWTESSTIGSQDTSYPRNSYDTEAREACQEERDREQQLHAAFTTVIGLIATTALVVLTMKLKLKVEEVNDGIAAGSIFTAIYTTVWAGAADHRILLFLSGTSFLVSAIVAGLTKFKPKA